MVAPARLWPLVAALLLAGCASEKMYANREPANFIVKAHVQSGSSLSSAAVAVDIHRMRSPCDLEYEGRVWFDAAEIRIGVPVGQPMFLSFGFASGGLFSNPSSFRQDTMFMARPGYVYLADVTYARGLYDVQLRETRPGVTGSRVIELRPRPSC